MDLKESTDPAALIGLGRLVHSRDSRVMKQVFVLNSSRDCHHQLNPAALWTIIEQRFTRRNKECWNIKRHEKWKHRLTPPPPVFHHYIKWVRPNDWASYCCIICHIISYCYIICHIISYCYIICHISYCYIICHIISYCYIICHIISYCLDSSPGSSCDIHTHK